MMGHSPDLLGLPRELRDMIYEYYVTIPGGYKYDFDGNKLITMDDKPVDLAPMYTCTLVAHEMKGFALRYNTITFSTVYSEKLRLLAGRWDSTLAQLYLHKRSILLESTSIITDENANDIAEKLAASPRLVRPVTALQPITAAKLKRFIQCMASDWNKCRGIKQEMVQIVSQIPGFNGLEDSFQQNPRSQEEDLVSADWCPWNIPDEKELDQMTLLVYRRDAGRIFRYWSQLNDCSKWRISATAAAIRFLGSISHFCRGSLCRILLLEDHEGVAYPECHAFGLIPFCKENPRFRVERRVSLWRNILLKCDDILSRPSSPYRRFTGEGEIKTSGVIANRIPPVISSWLVETHRLIAGGMPPESFKLTIDGEPSLEASSEVFQLLQEHVAWILAFEEARKRQMFHVDDWYPSEDWQAYTNAFQDLVYQRSSLIQCNFYPGTRVDVKKIIIENRGFDMTAWIHGIEYLHSGTVDPSPPLPSMEDIRKENFIWDPDYEEAKWRRKLESEREF